MWSLDGLGPKITRLGVVLAMTVALTGCFRPMYAERADGSSVIGDLAGVYIPPLGTRYGQKIRNELIFQFAGNGEPAGADYTLQLSVTRVLTSMIVRPNRDADVRILQLNAAFSLVDQATGKVLSSSSTIARASYEYSNQLFANERALIDAEDRAANTVAKDIQVRVAAFLAAHKAGAS